MPRVPQVAGPSVADAPLQTSPQRSSASPSLLQNTQLEQAGRAMQDIGAVIQERSDADLVMRAETEIKSKYLEWEGEAKQRRGQQAWGVAKEAGTWFDDNAPKVGEMLTTDRQRALFGRTVLQMKGQSIGAFSGFEAGQRRDSLDQSAQASIVGSINMAAANPNDTTLLQATKVDITRRNQMRAQINGWSPEITAAKEAEYLTNFHKQVIQGLVKDNPGQAAAYFEANKGEIEGSQHAEIGGFAQKATATRLGETTADAVWVKAGPKGDRDPVQLDVLEGEIRKALGTNDEARKAAIASVRERAAAFKDGRKERDDQTEASVNTAILKGAGVSQIQRMPEFLQLDGEKQRKLVDFMEARSLRREQQSAARESRAASADVREQSRRTREGMGAYLVYSNPDTLAGMTENQVLNLLPDLGNELTNHLMSQKRALSSPGKLTEARMDADDFDHIGRQMKLPVDEKSSPEVRAQMGELKYRVEQRIAAAQQQTGKPLARNEKMDLMRREMAQTVSVSGWFSNTDVPVIALTSKQVADVVIPTPDRKALSEAMRTMYQRTGAKQYEPSDENLRRFYLLSKSPAGDMILPRK